MELEQMQELVDTAILEGIIEAECVACGISVQCEPDATAAWCEQCNEVVKVNNPLIALGLI